jgi:uncharacterized linocin/CFP29 family protein
MSHKLSSFLRESWFAVLTCVGMLIHGYYTMNYAQKDTTREINTLTSEVKNLSEFGSKPLKNLEGVVTMHTNDISEMKRFIFKSDRAMGRFERNLDRVTWVVEELAKKQGIIPPKTLPSEFE